MFTPGVVVSIVGIIVLLFIIPIYKGSHQKKEQKPINWGIVIAWVIGIIGALVMGYGMSKVMVKDASTNVMLIDIVTSVIGLLICVLDYPIYSYIKGNKN